MLGLLFYKAKTTIIIGEKQLLASALIGGGAKYPLDTCIYITDIVSQV